MLAGCDLFSGIGGAGIALAEWVRPSLYCEIDPYCRGVLMSRMADGRIPAAPVFHDVRDLAVDPGRVDIITGGFPCQDISVAGNGAGLAGKRSGLVFEIFRLIGEARPAFVFLENVPAIRTRGAERVVKELAALGYDCRWDCLSAFDVGAPHKRERWWMLAHRRGGALPDADGQSVRHPEQRQAGRRDDFQDRGSCEPIDDGTPWALAHADGGGLQGERLAQSSWVEGACGRQPDRCGPSGEFDDGAERHDWPAEPDVGRVAHGVPKRVDRLRALGNAWVPAQAQEAFRRLMGIA